MKYSVLTLSLIAVVTLGWTFTRRSQRANSPVVEMVNTAAANSAATNDAPAPAIVNAVTAKDALVPAIKNTPSESQRFPLFAERRFAMTESSVDTQQTVHLRGTVRDRRWLDSVWVIVERTNAQKGEPTRQNDSIAPVSSDGSFDALVPLTLGKGTYTITLQAPVLAAHDSDDQTLNPVIEWQYAY